MPAALPKPQISLEEFEKRLLEARVDSQAPSTLDDFSPETLAWMALAPAWPLVLALRGYPVGSTLATGRPVRDLLARMANTGVCEVRRSAAAAADSDTPMEYFMSAAQKEAVRRHFRDRGFNLVDELRRHYSNAAAAMRKAWDAHIREQINELPDSVGRRMDGPLERWVTLGAHASKARDMAEFFIGQVNTAIRQAEDSGATALPEVARWIETVESLANWFSGPLEAALVTAKRKRELFHRHAYDHRLLANYFIRPAQDEAFRALLDGPDDQWAMHYVGDGGTGKTMFLRHLATHLGRSRDLVMARIDFDHLNPDYPEHAPQLFLASLAEELRLYEDAGSRTSLNAFAHFDQLVERLQERTLAKADTGEATFELSQSDVDSLLSNFCAGLETVAHRRRVLLVLDTCEELAKIRADSKLPKSVEVTFQVLERIHHRLPSLRVIFSGRRPLASRGAGWERIGNGALHPLPERLYLRLHEILGFSRQEAQDFLESYKKAEQELQRRVQPGLFETIFKHSQVEERAKGRRFVFKGDEDADREQVRYNIFDLDLFASWSCADPELSADRIAGGIHLYVRERILGRLSPLLRAHVPAIVLTERFDQPILEGLLGEANPSLVEELTNQEWIDLDRVSKQKNPVWLVQPITHRRLLKYYQEHEQESALLCQAHRPVADLLFRVTLGRPWGALSPGYFRAVLRVLHAHPQEAAAWWTKVELRVAADAEWPWACSLAETLLANEGQELIGQANLRNALRPAILALQAADRTHRAAHEADAIWQEVEATAEHYPTLEGRARLRFRARAGRLASTKPSFLQQKDGYAQLDQRLAATHKAYLAWRELSGEAPGGLYLQWQLQASAIAALEAIVELLERQAAAGDPLDNALVGRANRFLTTLEDLAESLPAPADVVLPSHRLQRVLQHRLAQLGRLLDLTTQWWILRARLTLLQDKNSVSDHAFRRGMQAALKLPTPASQRWLDWRSVDDAVARTQLEFLRLCYPRITSARQALNMFPALLQQNSIDADRLASARLALECVLQPPPALNAEEAIAPSASQEVAPTCNAHRAFPAYAVTALEAEAMRGGLDSAVRILRQIRDGAVGETRLELQRSAERALMRLAIRFNLTDEPGIAFGASLADSHDLQDLTLRAMLAVLEGERSTDLIREALDAAQSTVTGPAQAQALAHLRWLLGATVQQLSLPEWQGIVGFGAMTLEIDRLIDGEDTGDRPLTIRPELLADEHPVEALTTALRARAIDPARTVSRGLIERIGVRRAADLALVEGMLMTRRGGPKCGISLLKLAAELFRECNDAVGAYLAELRLLMAKVELREAVRVSALVRSYEACREQVGNLPEWRELQNIVEGQATANPLTLLEPLSKFGGWRPCLVRSMGVLVSAAELQDRDLPGAPAVRDWIGQYYSTKRDEKISLAPDLAPWAGARVPPTLWRRALKLAGTVGRIILAFAFGLAAIGIILKGVIWVVTKTTAGIEKVLEVPVNPWLVFAIYLCLIIIARFSRKILVWLAFPTIWCTSLRFSIIPSEDRANPNAPLARPILIKREATFFHALWRFDASTPLEQITTRPNSDPEMPVYEKVPDFLPKAITKSLRRVARFAMPAGWRVRLQLDESVTAIPWEAAFALASGAKQVSDCSYACRRILAAAETSRIGTIALPMPVTVWTQGEYLADCASGAWQQGISAHAFKIGFESGFVHDYSQPAREPGIVHLLGTPRDTNLGVALSLEGERKQGTNLLRASEVIERKPGVQLCILQAPLDEDIRQRNEQRRQEAGLLRRFGAALFKTGIPAVLVLPPLTEELHKQVFGLLCRALAQPRHYAERPWLHMLWRVQEAISVSLKPSLLASVASKPTDATSASGAAHPEHTESRQAALEIAFDVCLYLVDDFIWDLTPEGKTIVRPAAGIRSMLR